MDPMDIEYFRDLLYRTRDEIAVEERLRQVEDALGRIDGGTYGTCIACGRPIVNERLELVPETPYCVEDAAKANG